MGIRLTGLSTPVGGASWEYTGKKPRLDEMDMIPSRKIRVFISSICGLPKYDKIREELKNRIERTQLATVYLFEDENASSLSAGMHYISELEDSDICVFLIDNADGISDGVAKEIDVVKRNKIKALYYFCDEQSKEKTMLEKSLIGACFAKTKTVQQFSELSENGAKGFIDDIVRVYHNYCRDRISETQSVLEESQKTDLDSIEKYQMQTIPKIMLDNVDKCSSYILAFAVKYTASFDKLQKTGTMDEWCVQFLSILFEGRSIKNFNTSMYLDELKKQQGEEHYNIVKIRWSAIESYFLGDTKGCMKHLNVALDLARSTNQPSWVIKDILIDLRNQHYVYCEELNVFSESDAQKEITDSEDGLYYPILDRINDSINEKYIEDAYKEQIKSPYSVVIGGNVEQYGQMLASAFVVMMYNGSLTHIVLFYEKMKSFLFHLCCMHDDWSCRLSLYKLAIFTGNKKEITGLKNTYPEVLNKLTSQEASEIMLFCENHPTKHKRIKRRLLAFATVGYYLSDQKFVSCEKTFFADVDDCLKDKILMLAVGDRIFDALSGVAHRVMQEKMSAVCCGFMEQHYCRWYTNMFEFIAQHIKLQEMSEQAAKELVDKISLVLENEKERGAMSREPRFLAVLRKQNTELTQCWEEKIIQYFPQYFENNYKLVAFPNDDCLGKITRGLTCIKQRNKQQGKGGIYYGYAIREIERIRLLLLDNDLVIDSKTIGEMVSVVSETLLYSKESVSVKLDAIMLLICIAVKYPIDLEQNRAAYEYIIQQNEWMELGVSSILSSNIDGISLKIGMEFLRMSIGESIYTELLQLMPYIRNDIPTTETVIHLIAEYLDVGRNIIFSADVMSIILQNVLQWLCSENLNIRWESTRILVFLLRNKEYQDLINQQLIKLIESESVEIKTLIMRQINGEEGICENTRAYIFSKCKDDANFVVRKVHKELTGHELLKEARN
ncbi:MAG: hypothetical protein R3Y06_05390 [Faecalibacterium sp.]